MENYYYDNFPLGCQSDSATDRERASAVEEKGWLLVIVMGKSESSF